MADDRWLVLGLGNTGDQYSTTRHNIGQMVIDYLASDAKYSNHKSKTQITDIRVAGHPVVLAKTLGYMNESGGPAKALADFYKVSPNMGAYLIDLFIDRLRVLALQTISVT